MTLNKTKIIATLGPSSTGKSMLKSLMKEGVNVFRVNFSHANHSEVKKTVFNIREISSLLGLHITILGDLQGPKIRLGTVKDDVFIENGAAWRKGGQVDYLSAVGFEIKSELIIAYGFVLPVNLGYAYGLDDAKGGGRAYARIGYAF